MSIFNRITNNAHNNHTLSSTDRDVWMADIVTIQAKIERKPKYFILIIDNSILRKDIQSFHIVTLSCIIALAFKLNVSIKLTIKNTELKAFLFKDNRLKRYWTNSEIERGNIPEYQPYNLWRIEDKFSFGYANTLQMYFKNTFFKTKDLTGIKSCIDELFQNIIDHSKANGIAFASFEYKEKEHLIDIAVCDFGVGIPCTLRCLYKDDDTILLKKSMERGVSAETKNHNRGWGMDNIVSTLSENDPFYIVSNQASLYKQGYESDAITEKLKYNFSGTLIYFTISTKVLEEEETLEEFTF